MEIVLPGNPVPLQRHRHTKTGTYNPQKKEMIANSYIIKSQYSGPQLIGPLSISIIFYIQIPKSYSKRLKKELDNKPCNNNCDLDNYVKKCWDELNYSQIILDDHQFVELTAKKLYSSSKPRTEINIEEITIEEESSPT